MQWLINEFREFKQAVSQKVDAAITKWAQDQIAAAERIRKLEGEMKAMKARMGKKNNKAQDDGNRPSSTD